MFEVGFANGVVVVFFHELNGVHSNGIGLKVRERSTDSTAGGCSMVMQLKNDIYKTGTAFIYILTFSE